MQQSTLMQINHLPNQLLIMMLL